MIECWLKTVLFKGCISGFYKYVHIIPRVIPCVSIGRFIDMNILVGSVGENEKNYCVLICCGWFDLGKRKKCKTF